MNGARAGVHAARAPAHKLSVSDMARHAGPPHENAMPEHPHPPESSGAAALISRQLYSARTVLIFGEVTTELAESVSAQLLALAAAGPQPIRVLLHSPGGHVEAGDTIHDVIRFIGPRVQMLASGWVASAGALIYAAAPHPHRLSLPNTRFLLHQPLGGVGGPATDVEIEARQISLMRQRLNRVFAEATGQPEAKLLQDTERNHWLSATEALEYGLVSRIVERATELDAL